MKTERKYIKELKRQFGYHATWLPGTKIELGDIGTMVKGTFVKISNLEDKGISFEIEYDTTKTNLDHASKGSVSISSKASGSIPSAGSVLKEGEAGITVNFNREKSILFKAKGTLSHSIKDQIKLGKDIIKLYEAGDWNINLVVVTEVVVADSATILISNSSNAKIELKAKAELNVSSVGITSADLDINPAFSHGLSTEIIASSGITPLFRARKVKAGWFRKPGLKNFTIRKSDVYSPNEASADSEQLTFDEIDPEETF